VPTTLPPGPRITALPFRFPPATRRARQRKRVPPVLAPTSTTFPPRTRPVTKYTPAASRAPESIASVPVTETFAWSSATATLTPVPAMVRLPS
jgi:hypothetical protein